MTALAGNPPVASFRLSLIYARPLTPRLPQLLDYDLFLVVANARRAENEVICPKDLPQELKRSTEWTDVITGNLGDYDLVYFQ